MPDRSLNEPARRTPLLAETEVLVLGGGPAGIAAAASAAATGREVLLVERYGFLGGMGTAAGVTNFCGLHANVHGEMKRVVHGVADELLQRIDALGGLNEPHSIFGRTLAQAYDGAAYKCAADELLLARGVKLLFHALAAGVVMHDADRIDALLVETRSGRRAIRAQTFIDASGDGDLFAWAGAPWEKGDAQGELLYPTLMFRVGGVDDARAGEAWREVGPRMAAGAAQRPPPLCAAGRDPAADEARRRMARQRHPDPQRCRPRDGRHRCAAAVGRRGRGPAPGARLLRLPAHPRCPASRTPTCWRSHRRWASARRGACSAARC